MKLELDPRDAELLASALTSHIQELTVELSHTDRKQLQHELAQMVSRLEAVSARLGDLRTREVPRTATGPM
jgi:hypothetical protein